ncbi:MAG: type II toxin-antitoxin system RelE family toxin [Elainellaceae cyanobacterium]
MIDPSLYKIRLTPLALRRLTDISDVHDRTLVGDRLHRLKKEPETQGKPLIGKLFGYRSVRTDNHCHRIIYRLEHQTIVVVMVEREQHNGRARTGIHAMLAHAIIKCC